jgi:hypothetical protein
MMNPFLQVPPEKTGKNRTTINEELAVQQYAQTVRSSSPRRNIGLWLGNLLIRMGKKLAEQDIEMKTSKEHA